MTPTEFVERHARLSECIRFNNGWYKETARTQSEKQTALEERFVDQFTAQGDSMHLLYTAVAMYSDDATDSEWRLGHRCAAEIGCDGMREAVDVADFAFRIRWHDLNY